MQEGHGLSVREALHRPQQGVSYRGVEQRGGGRAVGVAGDERRDDGRGFHMDATAGKQNIFLDTCFLSRPCQYVTDKTRHLNRFRTISIFSDSLQTKQPIY